MLQSENQMLDNIHNHILSRLIKLVICDQKFLKTMVRTVIKND